ncbi:hypothetical protein KKA17_08810 [bacterium]|nr:hypothetical protein [bacterium]MBU1883035.1 hypothetical protein [bacterium]
MRDNTVSVDLKNEAEEFLEKLFEFTKNFEKLPSISKKFNWYIEPLIQLRSLKKLFQECENEKKVDEILSKHYKKNIKRIFDDLKNAFPTRKNIFDEIYYAHKKKLYYLSTIALMTQIDGLVYDVFNGKNYFQGDFFKKKIEMLEEREKTVGLCFLKQLFNNELPIRISQSKRTLEFEHMNRHQMLHGETLDFNTEINSLKAVSLLATLAFNMKYLDELNINDISKNGEI